MSLEPTGLGRRRSWGITEWNRPSWLERCKISWHTLSSAPSQGHVQISTADSLPSHKSCGFIFQYQPGHLLTLTLSHNAMELLDWCGAKSAWKQGYQIKSAAWLFFSRLLFFFFLRLTSQKCIISKFTSMLLPICWIWETTLCMDTSLKTGFYNPCLFHL